MKGSMASRLLVRLPADVKEYLEREASENASSQNSEVVRCIRSAMKKVGTAEAATSPRPGHGLSLTGENQ
ncbi:MAG: hypothetical protein H6R00_2470 [Proteobacteria bacterium]|nr:hypothetical protein [Pseudomonadota bacterium]